MEWIVVAGDEFEQEFPNLSEEVQDAMQTLVLMLKQTGPNLGRPYADTLKGSRYANMKELRFDAADGVWRLAFAFDPKRKAILLIAGDKAGINEARFYRELIRKADGRYETHLKRLKGK